MNLDKHPCHLHDAHLKNICPCKTKYDHDFLSFIDATAISSSSSCIVFLPACVAPSCTAMSLNVSQTTTTTTSSVKLGNHSFNNISCLQTKKKPFCTCDVDCMMMMIVKKRIEKQNSIKLSSHQVRYQWLLHVLLLCMWSIDLIKPTWWLDK